MGDCWVHLTIRNSVKNMLREQCKEEFLRHHPEFKGSHITDNLILTQIIQYYLTT